MVESVPWPTIPLGSFWNLSPPLLLLLAFPKLSLRVSSFREPGLVTYSLGRNVVPTDPVPLSAGTDNGLLDCVQFRRFPFSFLFPAESGTQAINVQISDVHLFVVTAQCTF